MSSQIRAQEVASTWNGSYGTWNTADNWSPAQVPNNGGGTNYTVTFSAGGAQLENDVTVDGLDYAGGGISGAYNITVLNNLNLSGADRSLGITQLILAPGSQSQWISGNLSIWGTTQTHNYGTFTVLSADSLEYDIDLDHLLRDTYGGVFYNESGGVFNMAGTGSLTFGGDFRNLGTLNQSGGAITFNGVVTNTGTVRQTGGTILANGQLTQTAGTFYVGAGATLSGSLVFQGGVLGGNGTINPYGNLAIANGTVLDPGDAPGVAGRLTTSSKLVLSGGTLHADIGGLLAGTEYDQMVAANYSDLSGGTLEISLINGFTPATNDMFTILLMGDSSLLAGSFLNATNGARLFTTDDSGSFLVSYGTGANQSQVVLSDFIAVPEPSAIALAGLGALLAAGWIVRRRDA